MKVICFFVTLFLFSGSLVGGEFSAGPDGLETFVDCCKAGIVGIQNGKVHVESKRFSMIQNQTVFLADNLIWIPISESLRDSLAVIGIEQYQEECKIKGICPKQHVGFYWSSKWNLWFCLNACPYNFYKNFPNGKGE